MGAGVTRRGCAGLAVGACSALARVRPAFAQTPLRLSIEGRLDGPSAAFAVAVDHEYYKAEDLDVAIEASAGGPDPVVRVASGAAEIGFGDINALLRFRDQNPAAPLKVIFVVNNRPSYALVGRKSRGVVQPADLEGKKLGAAAAEPATAQWPIFARINGIDAAKVTAINVGPAVREPMLAAGEVDAITGSNFTSPINMREKGIPADDISVMQMSAYGLEVYGNSIFVSAKLLAEKPDAVKGFVRAFLLGLKDTLKDPVNAVLPVIRRNGGVTRDLELERLLIAIRDCMVTPEVRQNGLGSIDPARFETGLDQIGLVYPFKARPKLAEVFDDSALPERSARDVD